MFTLVVDAREIGLGWLLVVDPDVLDLGLVGPVAMLKGRVWTCDILSICGQPCDPQQSPGQRIPTGVQGVPIATDDDSGPGLLARYAE